MNISLKNKIVLITGASRGIGAMLAKNFAEEQAIVIMNYFNSEQEAYAVYNEIIKKSPRSLIFKADVSNPEDVKLMYQRVSVFFDHIDVLINNAAICEDKLMNLLKYSEWIKVINTNLTSIFLCSKYFTKGMIKNKSGKIINISSLQGQRGNKGQSAYTSSKAGIIGLTKTLAMEMGKFNIAVNVICPGFIPTNEKRRNKKKIEISIQKSVLSMYEARNDLVNFIIYLSSDKCNGISGQVFNLDSRIL